MGIVETVLSEFELSEGKNVKIEHNSNGTVHVHMGDIRLNMTEAEYETFRETILNAKTTLDEMKSQDSSYKN